MLYWTKNKGIRVPIKDTNSVDFHIIGYATEKNHKKAEEVDNSAVNAYTVHYILEGSGYALVNGVRHEIDADSILVTFPNQNVLHRQNEETSWQLTWFVLDGVKVKSVLQRAGITPENNILKLERNNNLRKLLKHGPYECNKYYEISDIIAQQHFLELISFAYKYDVTPPRGSADIPSSAEKYVQQAIDYININYADESLNLTKIATYIGISPKYLSSIFSQIVGIKFANYLLNKRISVANMLIDNDTSSVSEIASKTGFSSPFYFSNTYKKHNGVSPKAHIKQHKQQKESDEKEKPADDCDEQ